MDKETVEMVAAAWKALVKEPVAIGMALFAVACAIATLASQLSIRDRLLTAAMAVLGGIAAWMMASRWRWPD